MPETADKPKRTRAKEQIAIQLCVDYSNNQAPNSWKDMDEFPSFKTTDEANRYLLKNGVDGSRYRIIGIKCVRKIGVVKEEKRRFI